MVLPWRLGDVLLAALPHHHDRRQHPPQQEQRVVVPLLTVVAAQPSAPSRNTPFAPRPIPGRREPSISPPNPTRRKCSISAVRQLWDGKPRPDPRGRCAAWPPASRGAGQGGSAEVRARCLGAAVDRRPGDSRLTSAAALGPTGPASIAGLDSPRRWRRSSSRGWSPPRERRGEPIGLGTARAPPPARWSTRCRAQSRRRPRRFWRRRTPTVWTAARLGNATAWAWASKRTCQSGSVSAGSGRSCRHSPARGRPGHRSAVPTSGSSSPAAAGTGQWWWRLA